MHNAVDLNDETKAQMCFIASLAIEQNPVAEIFGLALECFLFPGLFLDMHSTALVFNHIKQSWATTWQNQNIKSYDSSVYNDIRLF